MRRGWRSVFFLSAGLLWAQTVFAQDVAPDPAEPPATSRPVKRQPPKKSPQSAAATCARGSFKGDPACFGADDPQALPTPTARASGEGAYRAGDLSLQPRAGANVGNHAYREPSADSGNNPNPNPRTTLFGGGLGLKLPF